MPQYQQNNSGVGGGILSHIKLDIEDEYLNRNPDITLFKGTYKRYTHYSSQDFTLNPISIRPNNQNSIYEFNIDKIGDMLHKIYLTFEVDAIDSTNVQRYYKQFIGHKIIKRCWIEIDNVLYDQFDGDWLQICYEHTLTAGKQKSLIRMVTHIDNNDMPTNGFSKKLIYVHLPFWFSQDMSQCIPLCSMKYSEIKIYLELSPFSELSNDGSGSFLKEPTLLAQYIYLNEDERRKIVSQDLEYLITQIQIEQFPVNGKHFRLYSGMERLIKALIWVFKSQSSLPGEFQTMNIFESFTMYFNGHKRFQERNSKYFNQIQPFQHCVKVGQQNKQFMYSFSLFPQLIQPSGSINFTAIEDKLFEIKLTSEFNGIVKFFGYGLNIMKVSGGKSSLIFSY